MHHQQQDDHDDCFHCSADINRRRSPPWSLTCLRGALPPVDLRAVCLVRAIVNVVDVVVVVVGLIQ